MLDRQTVLISEIAEGRPFLCSYGGGHANIIAPVAQALAKRGRDFTLMGFTTAFEAFRRAGLAPIDVTALVDPEEDAGHARMLAPLVPPTGHPDISDAQTEAYFLAGFRDLAGRDGTELALECVRQHGRTAFEPVSTFRRFFERIEPSIVVTTTSPRFEVAAVKAARSLGIPSVAIGDMFLIQEKAWVTGTDYADHLVVIDERVGEMLRKEGLGAETDIHVLGNPAFDTLLPSGDGDLRRELLRQKMGVEATTLILWPLGGAENSTTDRALLSAAQAGAMLDDICSRPTGMSFVLRPHPNWPVGEMQFQHGWVDGATALEDVLLAADVVCAEASTVGFQAALLGIPVICYNYADYVLYPEFGWANQADTPSELERQLVSGAIASAPRSARANIGVATASVVDLIDDILRLAR